MINQFDIDLDRVIKKIHSGDIEEADKLVTDLIKSNSESIPLLEIGSIIKIQLRDFKRAEFFLKKILNLDKNNLSARFNLCKVLDEQSLYDEAEECIRILCDKNPRDEFYLVFFNILIKKGAYEKIISEWESFFSSSSNDSGILNAVGVAFSKIKNYSKAEEIFLKAAQLNENSFQIWNNLGQLYIKLCNFLNAKKCLKKSISINDSFHETWNNYGIVLEKKGDVKGALQAYGRAISLSPNSEECINNMASALLQEKNYHEAFTVLNKYIENAEPKFLYGLYLFSSMFICHWNNYKHNINRLISLISSSKNSIVSPFHSLSLLEDAVIQKSQIEKWVNENLFLYPSQSLMAITSNLDKKIRIGYFSPDFYNHPVSYLMAEIFEIHNRVNFEVFGFLLHKCPVDDMNLRLKSTFDEFFDVHQMDDYDLINFARDKQLDIAVDLCGYTQNNRVNIFFNRVAPVQISYLGFLGTLGFESMDYIIADHSLIPESTQNNFTEKILYLNCYQANDTKRPRPNLNLTKTDYQIDDDSFVFCCFNNTYKLNPLIFNAWISILKSSPVNSVLWLYCANPSAEINLKEWFENSGLSAKRLIISYNQPREIYLSQFKLCDLFLDTYPYNAGTTASDSLWMGTPVLTVSGKTFASRVCASLLTSSGLSDLITTSIEDYIQKAIDLAKNPSVIKAYKDHLNQSGLNFIDLFNSEKFIYDYESKLKRLVNK